MSSKIVGFFINASVVVLVSFSFLISTQIAQAYGEVLSGGYVNMNGVFEYGGWHYTDDVKDIDGIGGTGKSCITQTQCSSRIIFWSDIQKSWFAGFQNGYAEYENDYAVGSDGGGLCASPYVISDIKVSVGINFNFAGRNPAGGDSWVLKYKCALPPPPVPYTLKCSGEFFESGSGKNYTNIKWTSIPVTGTGYTPKTYAWGDDVTKSGLGVGNTTDAVAYSYSSVNNTGKASITGSGTYTKTGQVINSSNTDNTCQYTPVKKLAATCTAKINYVTDPLTGVVKSNLTFVGKVDGGSSPAYTWKIGTKTYTGSSIDVLASSSKSVTATVKATSNFSNSRTSYSVSSSNTNNSCTIVSAPAVNPTVSCSGAPDVNGSLKWTVSASVGGNNSPVGLSYLWKDGSTTPSETLAYPFSGTNSAVNQTNYVTVKTSDGGSTKATCSAVAYAGCFVYAEGGYGAESGFGPTYVKGMIDSFNSAKRTNQVGLIIGKTDYAKPFSDTLVSEITALKAANPNVKILVAAHSIAAIGAYNAESLLGDLGNNVDYLLFDPPYKADQRFLGLTPPSWFTTLFGSVFSGIENVSQIQLARNAGIASDPDTIIWTDGLSKVYDSAGPDDASNSDKLDNDHVRFDPSSTFYDPNALSRIGTWLNANCTPTYIHITTPTVGTKKSTLGKTNSCSTGQSLIGGICSAATNIKNDIANLIEGKGITQSISSYDSGVSGDIQQLTNYASDPSVTKETGHLVVKFGDGTVMDYSGKSYADSVGWDSAIAQAQNDAKKYGGVASVTDMHNHPTTVTSNIGLADNGVGDPPSTADFIFGIMTSAINFPGANITNIAVDGQGNVWQFSVPKDSKFFQDLVATYQQTKAAGKDVYVGSVKNVWNYDYGRNNDYGGVGDSTSDYLKAVKASGAIIKKLKK